MPLPNFFIVGPPKTGTTSLYHYLAQHPDVYMSPIKEPGFFAPDIVRTDASRRHLAREIPKVTAFIQGPMRRRRMGGLVYDWDLYCDLFRFAGNARAVGEATVYYLASEYAPRAIAERVRDARIIIVFRDPVDRAVAFWRAQHRRGATRTGFAEWWRRQLDEEARLRAPFQPLWSGRYGTHLRRWLEHVPAEQISGVAYRRLARDPNGVVRDLCGALGIDPESPIDVSMRHNVSRAAAWPALLRLPGPVLRGIAAMTPRALKRWFWSRPEPEVPPAARAGAEEYYRGEAREAERLLGERFPGW